MQTALLEKKKTTTKSSKSTKSVPIWIGSSKDIAASKKDMKMVDDQGNEITMGEMMEKSKEGGAGKGGRGR